MKVFDFDNTLYRGESSLDFSLYMIHRNKKILLYLPVIFSNAVRYKLCLVGKEELEKTINDYMKILIRSREEILDLVTSFWARNARKLDRRMISLIEPEDVIVTAGPSFLLDGIRSQLRTDHILSSEVDLERKEIIHFNFKDNKVRRFREIYGSRNIDRFYTDSYNDKAMMDISKRVYLVKNGKITRVK